MSIFRYIRIFLIVTVMGSLGAAAPDCLASPEKQGAPEEPAVFYVPMKAGRHAHAAPVKHFKKSPMDPIEKETDAMRKAIIHMEVKKRYQKMLNTIEAEEKKEAEEQKKKNKSFVAAFRDKAEKEAKDLVYTGVRWTAALIALNIIASSGWIVEGAGKLVFYGAENAVSVGDKFLGGLLRAGSQRPTATGWLFSLADHGVYRPVKYLLRPVF